MSFKLSVSVFLVILVTYEVVCNDGMRHFDGYTVLRLIPRTQTQLNYLRELEENVIELDFWKGPSYINRAVDVMVPPHLNRTFDKIFNARNLDKTVLINDLEKLIEEERAQPSWSLQRPGQTKPKPSRWNNTKADVVPNHFDDYQRLANIHSFLDAIVAKYPSISAVDSVGKSHEQRNLKLIKIGNNLSAKNKPIIFMEGGIHAREWISPATLQCFAQTLVQGYEANNADITALLNKFDFYILPSLNPDGYEYTHTTNRMWRKTRKLYNSCYGADPNRNFGYQWGGEGASTNPCSETYRGSSAFSEVETKSVSTYVLNIKARVKAYFAVHSYGQYWLYPWGYTSQVTPDDKDLNRMAKVATTALAQKYGTKYTVGTSTNVLYAAAGGADDWAYGSGGIKYSYTVELRDTGSYGFQLPKSQIRPTCEETSAGFIAFAKALSAEV